MTYHSLALLDIDLVAKDNLDDSQHHTRTASIVLTHKGEVIRVARRSLDQELVPPAVQRIEALGVVHVVHEDATVGTAVERHAQRLETLLASRVPEL